MPALSLARSRGVFAAAFLFCSGTAAVAQSAHPAYRAPERPSVPALSEELGGAAAQPIDAFVRRRLGEHGLEPSEPAEPAVLLRRLHLDLTGLPPSLDAVLEFEADPSTEAYERVVDRLLASPRFGEHWARHWLDLARYADSNGFQADQLRDSWAYRDFVIDAMNEDMPFDQFTIWQLAGDLLPQATVEQKVATGFHRTVTCNVEAGVHPEANRVNQVVDRVNTTATVWLGTTLECAQCHDHKYDPFSQREYFQLFAYFNNTPVEVVNPLGDRGVSFDFAGPWLDLPLRAEQREELRSAEVRRKALERRLEQSMRQADESRAAWESGLRDSLEAAPPWEVLEVTSFESTGGESSRRLRDGSVLVEGPVPDKSTYTLQVEMDLAGVTAFRLEALTHDDLPGSGPGRGDAKRPNFVLNELTLSARPDGSKQPAQKVDLRATFADFEQRGYDVARAVDGRRGSGWAVGGEGGFFEGHWALFEVRQPTVTSNRQLLTFRLVQVAGKGRTIGRLRLSALRGDPAAYRVPADVRRSLEKEVRTAGEAKRLRDYHLSSVPAVRGARRALAELERRVDAIRPDRTLVMVEQGEARETCVMRRGDYLQPGERVQPALPAALCGAEKQSPVDRLGLARWLVSRRNPLTARVTVNRWWAQVFGRGIVETLEDFGTRGAAPTHPELLDWLAVELMDSGWSMKHLLRLMVTSETYRQASHFGGTTDPDNRWLARGPRFRMSAEMIRDNALAVGGLLSLKSGGPPVFPPQPAGLWRQTGRGEPKYVIAENEDRFRRGIYVIWRRAAPYPSFVLFDGPDRSACHPRRSRTNTPMQALSLMNDTTFVEAALGLARLACQLGESPELTVETMFRRCVSRQPTPREVAHLAGVVARERLELQRDPAAAERLLSGYPAVRMPVDADPVEIATWFRVATVLLNLDETITKG